MKPLVFLTAVAIALVGLTTWAAPRLTGPESARAILAASIICVGAGWLAMLAPALVVPRYPDYAMQAGMAAMLIRLFLSLAVGWLYFRVSELPRSLFFNAMVAWYLVLLSIETWYTLRLVQRHWHMPDDQARGRSTTAR